MPFEPEYAIGTVIREGGQEQDFMRDDTALAYCGRDGLSIITGCSHAGICNMISYAKKVTGIRQVRSVLGREGKGNDCLFETGKDTGIISLPLHLVSGARCPARRMPLRGNRRRNGTGMAPLRSGA